MSGTPAGRAVNPRLLACDPTSDSLDWQVVAASLDSAYLIPGEHASPDPAQSHMPQHTHPAALPRESCLFTTAADGSPSLGPVMAASPGLHALSPESSDLLSGADTPAAAAPAALLAEPCPANLGAFFLWVDPTSPLANNRPADTMPADYLRTVEAWDGHLNPARDSASGAIGSGSGSGSGSGAAWAPVSVLNGAQCLAAVRAASAHPSLRGLAPAYLKAAAEGRWVRCVDLARLVLLWLCGGVYIDTDLAPGTAPLPAWLTGSATGTGCAEPGGSLLVVPGDKEGVAQNCFLAVPRGGHPVLGAVLAAGALAAVSESQVLEGTGPVLLSAVLAVLDSLEAAPLRLHRGRVPRRRR
ncbi:hypothetical protein FNF27_05819 [Cafeteria roenbergensis]|uniref:Uncharacterized protein n=1 Tax=Cafeteria roenbergensis TaxID=33653 RepID=A0A5A8E5K7_CAFRO|nr:hypothetical protein FNF27_05819 [Cafeteria roenbergensis]